MQRGFKAWCEKQALQWRKELDLSVHACLPARKLAGHLEIDVIRPQDIPDITQKDIERLIHLDPTSWSAVTVSTVGCTIIIFNPRHSTLRQEADIMHELAHIIRGHKPIGFNYIQGFPFPLRQYRKEDEEEAQWLGGCLQIPRDGLKWVLDRGMTEDEIVIHFVASPEMVRYRRNKTGIDIQRLRSQRNSLRFRKANK